ncbi:MAG: PD40 domain-containing protein [Armatimonadetes bacterium]|nr:PD40 domain-containing protein [Armatimonadota bacterium]
MNKRLRWLLPLALATWLLSGRATLPRGATDAGRAPRLSPEYRDLTVPPNIAPLNVRVAEPGRRFRARLSGSAGRPLVVRGHGATLRFPERAWHRLLAANAGRDLTLDVFVRGESGWTRFASVRNHVAQAPVDSHLVYRWFRPTYTTNTPLGLYQRDLTGFRQTALVRSRSSGPRCVNCHAFADGRPDQFSFQARLTKGSLPMVLVAGGHPRTVDTRTQPGQKPAALTTWHPSGRWLVVSRNWIRQYFHQAGSPGRDALDAKSALALVEVGSGKTVDPPELNPAGYMPTFPCWSPDGRWLYYSRFKRFWPEEVTMPLAEQPRVRYDLVRTAFDPERAAFGQTETVLAARDVDRSVLQPRVSPNGHWLVVTLAAYGGFPVFCPQADLALIDLTRQPARAVPLEPTATTCRETWHAWSSNSEWLVSARKSDNGLLARPYLRHIAADGAVGKAFVLPQADPSYYDDLLYTYNIPEFVRGPVAVPERTLSRALGREDAPDPAEAETDL